MFKVMGSIVLCITRGELEGVNFEEISFTIAGEDTESKESKLVFEGGKVKESLDSFFFFEDEVLKRSTIVDL